MSKTIRISVLVALLCATAGVSLGMQIFRMQECRAPVMAESHNRPDRHDRQNHVTLAPSLGGDDTDQIQQAFETVKAAGPGGTVELAAGTFTISRPVAVADFDGTFKGAGKDQTIVQNKVVLGGYFPAPPEPLPAFPSLFAFYSTTEQARGGSADNPVNLVISDMTLKEIGRAESWAFENGDSWIPANTFNDFVLVMGRNVAGTNEGLPGFANVTWKRMGLIGELDESIGQDSMNAMLGLDIWGWLKSTRNRNADGTGWIISPETMGEMGDDTQSLTGNFTVNDSTFEKVGESFAVNSVDNSDITFKNSIISDVVFMGADFESVKSTLRPSTIDVSNVKIVNPDPHSPASPIDPANIGYDAIYFGNISGANVNVTNLDTTNISGILMDQWDSAVVTAPSSFVFADNTIRGRPESEWAGFELWDFINIDTGRKTADVIVDKNNITSINTSEDWWGYYDAILVGGISDGIMSNNNISGKGRMAITIGLEDEEVDGWMLIKNDTKKFAASLTPIYLGPGTSNFTVVPGDKEEVVTDLGTGNKIVGANVSKKEVKPAVKEALEVVKQAVKSAKRMEKMGRGKGRMGNGKFGSRSGLLEQ